MAELTLIFFMLALGLFILGAYRRNQPVVFVTMILGVFSLTSALTDPEIGDNLAYIVILDVLVIMMSVVWVIFPHDDAGKRRRRRWPGKPPSWRTLRRSVSAGSLRSSR